MNAAPQTPGRRNAALIFIFVTVLIDVLSFGVIIPVLPGLVRQFTGGDADAPESMEYRPSGWSCDDPLEHGDLGPSSSGTING